MIVAYDCPTGIGGSAEQVSLIDPSFDATDDQTVGRSPV